MGNKTPLYDAHVSLGAKLVDFGGWDMPVHYGSQIEEHNSVRTSAGVFDVSHMTVVEIAGTGRRDYLDRLLANDIARMTREGQAMYTAMLNDTGGILDDLIVYSLDPADLAVVNCATREKDLAWMNKVAETFSCEIAERHDLAILAVQGPAAIAKTTALVSAAKGDVIENLKPFQGNWVEDWFIARTGYTGERGLEILLPNVAAAGFWNKLMDAGVKPIGLGARDTLRLEAGMNLYGSDMDETVTPLESNMANTVYLENRNFIGAEALRTQLREDHPRELVGLAMKGRGVLRAHYPVFSGEDGVGEITSGAFSPTLRHSIALARVSNVSDNMSVEIRGKIHPVECVMPPFVRNGKQVYKSYQPQR